MRCSTLSGASALAGGPAGAAIDAGDAGLDLVAITLSPSWAGSDNESTVEVVPVAAPSGQVPTLALTRDTESLSATTTLIDDLRIDPRALHLYVLKHLSRSSGSRCFARCCRRAPRRSR